MQLKLGGQGSDEVVTIGSTMIGKGKDHDHETTTWERERRLWMTKKANCQNSLSKVS